MSDPTSPRPRPIRPAPAPAPGVYAVGRGTLIAAAAAAALVSAWAGGATWYLLAKDDLAARFLRQQGEMQASYEERVGSLRARLDRVASQKLLEQDGVETRVSGLMARQVQLENRQAVLAALADQAGPTDAPVATGAIRTRDPALNEAPAAPAPQGVSAYLPVTAKPRPEAEFPELRLRDAGEAVAKPRAQLDRADVPAKLAAVDGSMLAIEVAQMRALDALHRGAEARARRLRSVVAETGLNPDKLEAPSGGSGTGGPLLPIAAGARAGEFETLAAKVQGSLAQAERLRRTSLALPLARPLPADPDLTSGYGYRLDPFTRTPALHTGLDFRAEPGTPVRAAGAGRVIAAEPSGGYGNMVEVDHGNDVVTRYAHLASIAVLPGQAVTAGTILGRVGSTGRSTGPHLHYETRVGGDPVNPQRFLRAGAQLAASEARAR